jgi:hypothetical protein
VIRSIGFVTLAALMTSGPVEAGQTADTVTRTVFVTAVDINRIYARNLTGSFLTDGILEVARVFGQREAERPVIVSIGVEGQDFSRARPQDVLPLCSERERNSTWCASAVTLIETASVPPRVGRGASCPRYGRPVSRESADSSRQARGTC